MHGLLAITRTRGRRKGSGATPSSSLHSLLLGLSLVCRGFVQAPGMCTALEIPQHVYGVDGNVMPTMRLPSRRVSPVACIALFESRGQGCDGFGMVPCAAGEATIVPFVDRVSSVSSFPSLMKALAQEVHAVAEQLFGLWDRLMRSLPGHVDYLSELLQVC